MMKQIVRLLSVIMAAFVLICPVLPAVQAASEYFDVIIPVTYHQTEARKEIDMVNAFRTSGDAWYWNEGSTEKIMTGKLPALTYDYDLEKVAMQRAAEIALFYSHKRADDRMCWQTYKDCGYAYGTAAENIAVGYKSAEDVFTGWREDDFPYILQGHRRNILTQKCTAFGVACVEYDGMLYWVQEFSDLPGSTAQTPANDSPEFRSVRARASHVGSWEQKTASLTIHQEDTGNIADLVGAGISIEHSDWEYQKDYRPVRPDFGWTSANSSILSLDGNVFTANERGETVISCETPDGKQTFQVNVNVVTAYEVKEWKWSDDCKSASLILEHFRDPSKQVTVKASVAVKETAPECEKDGSAVYTAKVIYEESEFTDTKKVILPASGHAYDVEYVWGANDGSVTGTATCEKCGNVINRGVGTYTETIKQATCEEDGLLRKIAPFNAAPFEVQSKEITVPKLGHLFDTMPVYTWSSDYSTATAKKVCSRDSSHTVEETVKTTYAVSVEPDCETDGVAYYTAAFKGEGFSTQRKSEILPAKGHRYVLKEWIWEADLKKASVRFICENNSRHTKDIPAEVKISETPASCEKDGKSVSKASVTFEGKTYTDTRERTIAKKGHKYGTPEYTWAADSSSVTAKTVCANDSTHVISETVKTEYTVVKKPTVSEEGRGMYKAVFTDSRFTVQTRTVTIPKLTPTPTPSAKTVDMYRIYNPNSGEHFYTSDKVEKDALVNKHKWKYEGVGWVAPVKSNTPVYRLYNKTGGEHHYTTDKKERDALINKYGWTDEGIGWYSDDNKTVKVYREYNPNAFANNHNYTPDTKEHNALINKYGWKDEGIAWYAVSGRK